MLPPLLGSVGFLQKNEKQKVISCVMIGFKLLYTWLMTALGFQLRGDLICKRPIVASMSVL